MPESRFHGWVAERYDALWPELFEPAVVEQTVEFLGGWAGPGSALEFGIGTGRIALPLSHRGVRVHGIELSPAMAARLRVRDPDVTVGVTIGDFATSTVEEQFTLVYLLRNTITNLTSQDEQVEAFRNAARHLHLGGHFLIENYVPELQRLPPGETRVVFTATPTHLGFEEYDVANQIAISHHYWVIDGELKQFASPHRYVWPAELDLMARMAGLTLCQRWAGWTREPFTAESRSHISVWEKVTSSDPLAHDDVLVLRTANGYPTGWPSGSADALPLSKDLGRHAHSYGAPAQISPSALSSRTTASCFP